MPVNKPKTDTAVGAEKSASVGMGFPMSVGSVAVQAWMDIETEAARFVWDRMQQDIKALQAMLACTSLQEVRKIQTAFLTDAQKQYAVEQGKMVDLMRKATAIGLAGSANARRYDDVPL